MNIDLIFNEIKAKLFKRGYFEVVRDLEDLIAAGSTSSEILLSSGKYLVELKKIKPATYEMIEDEITRYVQYCREVGLDIE